VSHTRVLWQCSSADIWGGVGARWPGRASRCIGYKREKLQAAIQCWVPQRRKRVRGGSNVPIVAVKAVKKKELEEIKENCSFI